jgi:hypothetical protein
MRVRVLSILALAVAACAPATASSPTASEAPSPATYEEFATTACDAFEAMFTAVGNPDSGAGSELSTQLDAAIERGDPAEANRLAEQMLAELARGRQAASAAAAWEPGAPAMAELNDVLVAFEAYVRAKQESAAGNPVDAQAALEAAGGVTSWQAMLEASLALIEARPSGPPHACDGIPMGW